MLEEIEHENGLIADITESMNEDKKEEEEDKTEDSIISTVSNSNASANTAIIQTPLIVAPSKDNIDVYLEYTASKTDENYRKIMILYGKKEAEGAMTIEDYHKMLKVNTSIL